MNKKTVARTILFSLSLVSCGKAKGRIYFVLNGGSFVSSAFSTTYLEGPAGEKIDVDIPSCQKDGYYFVGWQEKDKNGKYRPVDKRRSEDGSSYYLYPYGSTTLYAYFEPLVSLNFDLGAGQERGAELVAPVHDADSFSDNKLNGYVSKEIPDSSYLPTVTVPDGHLTFDYWYTKYPLVAVEDENKITHYSLDTTKEEGIYSFGESFGIESMEFPLRSEGYRTLYASYIEDPTITVHFGLEGKEDYSFQGKDSIESELKDRRKTQFGIDYSSSDERYFYPSDTKENRFAGFYIDENCTSPFYLDSPIGSQSFSLYLKWDKKISLTLDYREGNVNGKHSETFAGYYNGDILGKDFLSNHTPVKENASFSGFSYEGKSFDRSSSPLPDKTERTLTARYSDYPELTLSIDYPENFTGSKLPSLKAKASPNSNIQTILYSYIDSFNALNSEDHLYGKGFYLTENGKEQRLSSYLRPEEDRTLSFKADYEGKRTVKSYYNPSSSYQYLGEDHDRVKYASFEKDSAGNEIPDVLTRASFPHLADEVLAIGDSTYLYDGLYQDEARTLPFSFPVLLNTSHSQREESTCYRKRSKAIIISFYDYDTKASLNRSLPVLPSSHIEDYKAKLPNYKNLYVEQDGERVRLSSLWPSASRNVYIEA